ncbi:hypothetical protein PTKIN_Ptkin15bG0058700 [Pterospermum kingtungense]
MVSVPFYQVYDVASFLEDHPGGDEVLLAASGKDATEDFEDVGHSDDANQMMEKYYIGEVDSATVPIKKKFKAQTSSAVTHKHDESGFLIKILQFAVPLLILGVALGLQFLRKTEKAEEYIALFSHFRTLREPSCSGYAW